ncbi:MAG: hypothetical protein QFX33_02180 [Candidatus Nezhaarchaeota archaeon]|nr:hypothetical protein [Candidatus Nezhaarchaeota archaeon]
MSSLDLPRPPDLLMVSSKAPLTDSPSLNRSSNPSMVVPLSWAGSTPLHVNLFNVFSPTLLKFLAASSLPLRNWHSLVE